MNVQEVVPEPIPEIKIDNLAESVRRIVELDMPAFIIRGANEGELPITPEVAELLHIERADEIQRILGSDQSIAEHYPHGVHAGRVGDNRSTTHTSERGDLHHVPRTDQEHGRAHVDNVSSVLEEPKSEPFVQVHTTKQGGGGVRIAQLAPTLNQKRGDQEIDGDLDNGQLRLHEMDPDHFYEDTLKPGDTIVHRASKSLHRFDTDQTLGPREALIRSLAAHPGDNQYSPDKLSRQSAVLLEKDQQYREKHGIPTGIKPVDIPAGIG